MRYIVPELLDKIKEKYEGTVNDDLGKPISMYKLVLQSGADGFNLCFTDEEHVLEYDDLCVRMFELDMSGWEVMNVEDSEGCFDGLNPNETIGFILVTITLCRKL
jgi:hypothetical protein